MRLKKTIQVDSEGGEQSVSAALKALLDTDGVGKITVDIIYSDETVKPVRGFRNAVTEKGAAKGEGK